MSKTKIPLIKIGNKIPKLKIDSTLWSKIPVYAFLVANNVYPSLQSNTQSRSATNNAKSCSHDRVQVPTLTTDTTAHNGLQQPCVNNFHPEASDD